MGDTVAGATGMGSPTRETMVFLPGLDGTGISFEPLRAFLSPGMGVTIVRHPPEKLTFRETVDCAAGQLPCDEADVVVAESFSGPIAIELIGSGRLKAGRLILASTFARSPRPFLLGMASFLPLERLLGFDVPRPLLKHFLGGDEFAHELLPLWKRVRATVPAEILAHRLRLVNAADVRGRLPHLSMPCCTIRATRDVLVPPNACLDFVRGVPNLTVIRIDGPHFILQARPAASWKAMEEFRVFSRST